MKMEAMIQKELSLIQFQATTLNQMEMIQRVWLLLLLNFPQVHVYILCIILQFYVNGYTIEINLKQQLVDQLEKAQRSFQTMRAQYEDKMQLLQHQIKSIESERDRVLKDMSGFSFLVSALVY